MMLTRKSLIPALLRPGMYAGEQGTRTNNEWYADAIVIMLHAAGWTCKQDRKPDGVQVDVNLDNWQRFPDGSLKPFMPDYAYNELREDDRFLYNCGPKPEGLV